MGVSVQTPRPSSLDSPLPLIALNILSSVAIVSVNKLLVEYFHFKYVLLLTALHFFAGYAFLTVASSPSVRLFSRGSAPRGPIIRLAVAGAGSIALLNYSLRLNSVGTYQILKVAALPVTMALSYALRIATPTSREVGAAFIVACGTMVCTASDVWISTLGLVVGVLGVFSTALYQIWQGSVQRECGLTSTQVLHLMSLPQAWLTLGASVLMETDWTRLTAPAGTGASTLLRGRVVPMPPNVPPLDDAAARSGGYYTDIWSHPYTLREVGAILLTCACAIVLNYTTIAVIGKTSAVTMAFVNQIKTVLIVIVGVTLFHKPMAPEQAWATAAGLVLVFAGVGWYTKLKHAGR